MNQTTIYIVYFGFFFVAMYFLLIRPQQKQAKQRQALLSSLRVRDRVITAGGMYGKITKVKDNSVIMQIADKVEVEVAKSGITSVENRDSGAEKENKNDKNNKGVKLDKEETVDKVES